MHGSTNYINYCAEVPTPVSVVKPEFTKVKLVHDRIETDGGDAVTIPADMERVWIRNKGPINGGAVEKITVIHGTDEPFDIEVDGQHLFEKRYIDALCEIICIEEIKIITNGATVWIDTYEKA